MKNTNTNPLWDAKQISGVLRTLLEKWQEQTGATVTIHRRVVRRADYTSGVSYEFGVKGTQRGGKRMLVSVTEDDQ